LYEDSGEGASDGTSPTRYLFADGKLQAEQRDGHGLARNEHEIEVVLVSAHDGNARD